LISEDFPTLDRPIIAISGLSASGHIFQSVLDFTKTYFIFQNCKDATMLR
jgi:hypothetical protein